MTETHDWQAFLQAWFRATATLRPEGVEDVPPDLLAAGWFGAPGAGEERLRALERRLGTALPPSYHAFLSATDGCWLFNGYNFPYRFWSSVDVDWFAARHQEWIDAWTVAARDAEPIPVPDAVYLTYGPGQNPGLFREEYLQTALEVSDRGENASIFLLNPRVVTAEGEWEAWYLDGPYAFRYRSFWDMLQAQHEDFLGHWATG